MKSAIYLLVAVVVLLAVVVAPTAQSPDTSRPLGQLAFRYIGPVGNRIIAIAGIPRDPNVYYAGAASGGIFKTTDGGAHWDAIFDDQPVSSIGSLAVAPSDPNVIWAGTGESFIRSNISIGTGIYRSTDGGRTWTHAGLDQTGRIGRIVVDPSNADVALACALGHAYGPQEERGVFRTVDGGKTWQRTLFVDPNTGCSDIAMNARNPRILFAGMWQIEIHTWGRTSGGPGSGLFTSVDGGQTWTRLEGHGLPRAPIGKISPQIARSNPNRVYALIETGDGLPALDGTPTQTGSLWRSDDGGGNWEMVSADRRLRGRTHYYTRFAIEPDNENEAYFLSAEFTKTLDGGKTSIELSGKLAPVGDNHDMWIDPTDGNRFVVAHDDGLSFSVNRGRTWHQIQLPVAQMYHVATDNQIPYNVYGNRQDGPSTRGPSNSRLAKQSDDDISGPIPRGLWHSVAGGESGWAIPDPADNNIVWATGTGYGSLGGTVERFDERTRTAREVEIWPENTIGTAAGDVRYRFNWTFPIAISPHDHNVVYAGSQVVHRTADGGQTWQVISPDLSLNDRSQAGRSWYRSSTSPKPVVSGMSRSVTTKSKGWPISCACITSRYASDGFSASSTSRPRGLSWRLSARRRSGSSSTRSTFTGHTPRRRGPPPLPGAEGAGGDGDGRRPSAAADRPSPGCPPPRAGGAVAACARSLRRNGAFALESAWTIPSSFSWPRAGYPPPDASTTA